MKFKIQSKKTITIFFFVGAIIFILLGTKDSNFLGIMPKTGKQILNDIEKGISISREVKLSEKQKKEIKQLIYKSPEKYTPHQKALASDKSGKEILDDIDAERINVDNVYLNYEQLQEIKKLIYENPSNYTRHQKYLLRKIPGEEILRDVGNGKRNPNYIKLTPEQRSEIEQLITNNPEDYNDAQKSLLNK